MLTFSDFVLFLYQEKCLINYFDNIKNDEVFGAKDNVKCRVKLYMMCTPSDFLASAFKWDLSPEGHYFWADINNKWKWFVNHER